LIYFFKLLVYWSRNVVNRGICYDNVCPSQSRITPKRFKISKYFLHLTTERCFWFPSAKFRNPQFRGSQCYSAAISALKGGDSDTKNVSSNAWYLGNGAR